MFKNKTIMMFMLDEPDHMIVQLGTIPDEPMVGQDIPGERPYLDAFNVALGQGLITAPAEYKIEITVEDETTVYNVRTIWTPDDN